MDSTTMNHATHRWSTLLLLVILSMAAAPSGGLEASGSSKDRPVVGEDSWVHVVWRVDPGPGELLDVSSPIGRFGGLGSGTFGGPLGSELGAGRTTFPEVVRIPASLTRAALESGGAVVLRRRFDAVDTKGGPARSAEAVVRLAVSKPRLTLSVRPPSRQISVCLPPDEIALEWIFKSENLPALKIESSRGVVMANGRELVAPGGFLAGSERDRLVLFEMLAVTPDLLASALTNGGRFEYRRSFQARRIGFERRLEAGVAFELVDDEVVVTAVAEPSTLALERPTAVSLSWSAVGTGPCFELGSSELRVETSGGQLLARLARPLRLTAGGRVTELVTLPTALAQQLLDSGTREVVLARELEVSGPLPAASGTFAAPRAGGKAVRVVRQSVRLPWKTDPSPEPEASRVALRFADGEVFRRVVQDTRLTAVAEITTLGRGPIVGVWEVADPASTLGQPIFRPLELVHQMASLDGLTRLELTDLPTDVPGPHIVRLRLEQPQTVFEEPVLRYEVGPGWQPRAIAPIDSGLGETPESVTLESDDPIEEREILVLVAGRKRAERVSMLNLEVKMRYELETRWPTDGGEPLVLTVLRTPRGVPVAEVLRRIRSQHPRLWVDANDLYRPQGGFWRETEDETAEYWEELLDSVEGDSTIQSWRKKLGKCSTRESKVGIVDTPDHGTYLQRILKNLLPEESLDFCLPGDPLEDSSLGGFFGDSIAAEKIARKLDKLRSCDFVLVGVAGRSNWILKFFFWKGLGDHPVLVAPYDNQCRARCSYPATSGRVNGVMAIRDPDGLRLGGLCPEPGDLGELLESVKTGKNVYATEGAEECRNSCSVPLLASAFMAVGGPIHLEDTSNAPWVKKLDEMSSGVDIKLIEPHCSGEK